MELTKLTDELVELLKSRGKEETYKLGDVVISEGDESNKVYIIKKGYINVTKKDPMGNDVLIGTAGPGSIIGEMGVFLGTERTATVRAVSDLTLIAFDREEFFEIIGSIPEVASYLIGVLTKRLYNLNRRLINTINSKLMIVVGNYLVEKAKEKQEGVLEGAVDLSLDLSNMAFETGLDIEKVLTALGNLSKAGVIKDYKLVEEVKEDEDQGKKRVELKVDPSQLKSYLRTISYV